MTENNAPTVTDVKRHAGIAGSLSASAVVTYPGEAPRRVSFAGSVYGGPVAYTFETAEHGNVSGFVAAPDRFGDFAADPVEWVKRFHA